MLFLSSSPLRGGAEENLRVTAAAAVRRGWDVHTAFAERGDLRGLAHELRKDGATHYPVELAETVDMATENRRHLVRAARTARLLVRVRPDVVHLTLGLAWWGLGSMVAARCLGVPLAPVFQLVPEPVPFGRRKLVIYRWLRRGGQVPIVVSEHNRDMLARTFGVTAAELRRIYNAPIRQPRPSDDPLAAREELRRQLSLPSDARIVLSVGRLSWQKGLDLLAQVVPYVVREHSDVYFVWVGEGEQRGQLERSLGERGVADRVRLIGFREDVERFLQAADLFAFPSRFEGFGIALLEAMAVGLPVVTSDSTCLSELVADGHNGVVFRSGDVLHLLERLLWALAHPERMGRMADAGRERARDFSAERMLDETFGLLEALADGRPGRAQGRGQP